MMSIDNATLAAEISEAVDALALAHNELQETLAELDARERADKTMVSAVMRDVLVKVGSAQKKLAALRAQLV